MSWLTRYRRNHKTMLKIILLRTCPYSRALADLLKKFPRVEKVWVGRGSPAFYSYKDRHGAKTFPIAVLIEPLKQTTYIGGYEDVNKIIAAEKN